MDTNDIVNRILSFLETTGKALVVEGFRISVRYVIAQGITGLVFDLIALIILIFGLSFTKKFIRKYYEDTSKNEDYMWMFLLSGLMSFISALYILTTLRDNIMYLLTPEWYAIQNIINLMK